MYTKGHKLMIDREKRTKALYTALHDLSFSLNEDLLNALQVFTEDLSDQLLESGTIYNHYTLESLIHKFSDKYYRDLDIEQLYELKNNNSIECMNDYYDLIEYMITDIDI